MKVRLRSLRAGAPEPPAVRGLPLIGSLIDMRARRLELLAGLHPRCGDLAIVRMGPVKLYMASSAELAHRVLVRDSGDYEKSKAIARYARPIFGDGLLSCDRQTHRVQRRRMAPGFQLSGLARHAETIAGVALEVQESWGDGQVIDLTTEMKRILLGVVGRTMFGAAVEHETEQIGAAVLALNRYIVEQATSVPLPPSLPLPRNLRLRRALDRLDRIVFRFIGERRRDRSSDPQRDMLSMLLSARDQEDGSGMSDTQVRDEVMTLFLAGHETTATALTWALLLLDRHPPARERLRSEAAGLGARPPGADDLSRLSYTSRVLEETMRLYPPVYLIGRQTEREVELGGFRVPGGAYVGVNVYGIHRRPDYHAHPERFDPDRFAPERRSAIARYAYLPFGGGPRICIGNHFAMMTGTLVLAALASRVELSAVGPARGRLPRPIPLVTLEAPAPLRVRVRRIR